MATGRLYEWFEVNWVVIASFAGSVVYSAMVWMGVIFAVHRFVR